MKPLLLALSFALNVLLAFAVVARSPSAPPAFRDLFSWSAGPGADVAASSTAKGANPKSSASAKARTLWSSLATNDLPTLIARLRAAGFPPSMIRAVVSAEINARYTPRLRAFTDPDPNTPFWKGGTTLSARLDPERMAEYTRVQQERSKLLRELFKDEFFATGEVSAAQRRQYGNLSAEKLSQIQRIDDDYTELNAMLSAAMKGVLLPEDRAKLDLLNREKQADLAAILSPGELADYNMRSSPLTRMLAGEFGGFEPTDSEFRAIFQMQQTINDRFPVSISGGSLSGTTLDEGRRALQQELEQQLKATLGESRYAEYTRETEREFQQLSQLTKRDNLPASAAVQAYSVRETVSRESNRIVDDPSLAPAQKLAALQALAQNARAEILSALGPTSGPSYVKTVNNWLNNVEKGSAVSFNRSSGSFSVATSSNNSAVASAIYLGNSSTSFRPYNAANRGQQVNRPQ